MLGFNDIIGHEEIIRHLKNAIQTEKVSHSYIFTGDPGSGKKLLAGTYAMTLQCEEGGTEPCGHCDSCKKAIGKNHPDIDRKSTRLNSSHWKQSRMPSSA